jgi:hypothetical protein
MKSLGFNRCGVITLTAATAMSLLGQAANAQGVLWPLFHPRGSYMRTSSGVSAVAGSNVMMVPMQGMHTVSVSPTVISGFNMVPGTTVQMGGVTASPTFQLIQNPTNTVSVASAGSTPTYYLVRGMNPAVAQTAGVASAGTGLSDNDLAVLSAGFGNRISKISDLQQTLKNKQAVLASKNLDPSDLAALLEKEAQGFLSNSQFGIAFDAVEPIIARLIGQLLPSNNGNTTPPPTTPVAPAPGPSGNLNGNLSIGSQTLTISGTVTIGPLTGQTQGQTQIVTPPSTTPSIPANLPAIDNTKPAAPPGNN